MMMTVVILLSMVVITVKCSIRLKLDGSSIIDPITNKEILLKGFNWYLPYIEESDSNTMFELIPSTNIVRVQGIDWDNSQNPNEDCRTNDASHGYIKQSCIDQIDDAINIITSHNSATNENNNNIWVILTGRAEYAAGQSYPQYPDVFHNATLRNQYYAMWKYLALHYKSFDYIAAYEIMAEPRTKIVNQSVVQSFYQGACDIIHQSTVDMNTPCMVGPAPFYKPWMLNNTLIINGTNNVNNVLYTVDFYVPVNYIQSGSAGDEYNNLTYPGVYPCNVALPGWSCAATHHVPPCFCPENYKELVYVNKTWLINILTDYPLLFRNTYNLPLIINQWGIHEQVDVDRGKLVYVQDLMDIFNQFSIHSTCWVWKWRGTQPWHAYELIYNDTANDKLFIDYQRIDVINNTWNKTVY